MFDTENFSEIIHSAQETGNVYALGLFRLANKKLRMVRKMFVHGTSFCHKGKDAETLQLWLTENFEKLDSALGDCMGALLRMGRLRGKGKLPFYFDVFYRLCNKPCKMDEKLVDDILTECSENMKNPDLKTAKSLVPLFVSAVCIRICECFEGAESDFRDMAKILAETENLFYTLDSLCNFNEERAIKSNKVERALSEDSLYPFLTDETKASYRRNLSKLAKKKKMSELSLAEKLVGKSGKDGHIGEFLCDKPKGGRIYLSLLFGLSVFFKPGNAHDVLFTHAGRHCCHNMLLPPMYFI